MRTWRSDDGRVVLYCGDSLEVLPTLDGPIHTCVTDPPYGLEFMGKEWDHGIPAASTWKTVMGVMLPGAPLLAFGGTRTWHRLACAIEDAGFEVRDTLMWLHGQGFPKSLDISKAIDKAAGVEREVGGSPKPGHEKYYGTPATGNAEGWDRPWMHDDQASVRYHEATLPATDAAKLWDGYGTALKPAWEPIILAMKPLDGTFAENALAHGVAGLNIDGCRVGTESTRRPTGTAMYGKNAGWNPHNLQPVVGGSDNGRWPANTVLTHHPECVLRGTKVVRCDGSRPSSIGLGREGNHTKGIYGAKASKVTTAHVREDGTEEVEDWDCREDCPVRMLDEQAGDVRSSGGGGHRSGVNSGCGLGFMGAAPDGGRSVQYYGQGGPSRFFYTAKASRSERTVDGEVENRHPTVKPLDLMRWLVRLVSMPKGSTILDPFMGSGTTGVAAVLEGQRFIGIERDEENFKVAIERLREAGVYPDAESDDGQVRLTKDGQAKLF